MQLFGEETMVRVRRCVAVPIRRGMIGIVAAAFLLVACTPADDPSPSPSPTEETTSAAPSPTPSTATQSPTPSPTPSETLDADQIAARDVVNEFFRISEELLKDPDRPLQELADITTGVTQELELKNIAQWRAEGAVRTGELQWVVLTVGPNVQRTDGQFVVVQVCTDNSGADMVDSESRESLLPEDRSIFIHWTIDAVLEGSWWKVGDLTNTRVDSCPDA